MPHLKIVERGFDNYSGMFGDVEFKDGVSVESVTVAEARKLAGVLRCEEVGTGRNPSISQELIDTRHMELEEYNRVNARRSVTSSPESEQVNAEEAAPVVQVSSHEYTREDLESIADEKGIEGLREFASTYDVRGGSIKAIIDSLMAIKVESAKNEG